LKHCGLFPHRMDARDRHNGQRDKRTDGVFDVIRRVASLRPSVRPSLRWSLTLCNDAFYMYSNVKNCDFIWLDFDSR